MARSLFFAARFVSVFSESNAALTLRRGFAAAPSPAAMRKVPSKTEEKSLKDEPSSSWVPDPKTGFYRPANKSTDVDPAELREMLLSKRSPN